MRTGFLDRLGARLCETNLFALFLGLVTRNGAVGVVGVCDYEKGGCLHRWGTRLCETKPFALFRALVT